MCDTLCVVGRGGARFAKNSDRPVGERQVVEAHPRRAGGGRTRTQYLELDDPGAHAVVGSRPEWLWGFEHGVNEHGLAVGNEKIWTRDDPRRAPAALIGMDLVRLALERAAHADEAVATITGLLERHGQGGTCEAGSDEPYWSSFLVADPTGSWVVETSGRTWAARPAPEGTAISNLVAVGADWTRASSDVEPGSSFDTRRDPAVPTGIADHRLAVTRSAVATGVAALDARELAATLRDHGGHRWGRPGSTGTPAALPADVGDDWRGVTVCMHVRGYQATTASMIAELPDGDPVAGRLHAALGSPCVSAYVPWFPWADPDGPSAPGALARTSTWDRFAALRERVEADPQDPSGPLEEIRAELDPVEADLWAEADAIEARGDAGEAAAFGARAFGPVDAALTRLGV